MTDKGVKLHWMSILQDLDIDRELAAVSQECEIEKVLEMNKRIRQVYI
jgi:hypothetical protein